MSEIDIPADDSLGAARETERDRLQRAGISAVFLRLQRLVSVLRQEGGAVALSFAPEQRAGNALAYPGLPLSIAATLTVGSIPCAVEVPTLGNRAELVRIGFAAGDSDSFALADSDARERLLQRLRSLLARQDALAELLSALTPIEEGAALHREPWLSVEQSPAEARVFDPELVIIGDAEPAAEPPAPDEAKPDDAKPAPTLPLPRIGGDPMRKR